MRTWMETVGMFAHERGYINKPIKPESIQLFNEDKRNTTGKKWKTDLKKK